MDELNIDGAVYSTNFTNKFAMSRSKKPKNPKKKEIRAFIPGLITDIPAKEGRTVKARSNIISLEAMKMINEIVLDHDVVIDEICVKKGDTVEKDQLLVKYSLPKTKNTK